MKVVGRSRGGRPRNSCMCDIGVYKSEEHHESHTLRPFVIHSIKNRGISTGYQLEVENLNLWRSHLCLKFQPFRLTKMHSKFKVYRMKLLRSRRTFICPLVNLKTQGFCNQKNAIKIAPIIIVITPV